MRGRMGGMPNQRQLADTLTDIDRLIATAESPTVAKGDDDTLQRASEVLAALKEQRKDVEAKLRGE
jgi:hypothetical protein